MIFQNLKSRKKEYLMMLMIMLGITFLFLNSFYWPNEGISYRKIIVSVIGVFNVIVLPIVFVEVKWFYKMIESVFFHVKNYVFIMKKNKKKVLSFVLLVVLFSILSILITYFVSVFVFHTYFNFRLLFVLLTLDVACLLLFFLRKNAAKKPENIFAIVALSMGIICISVVPARVGVSWDDEIHFRHALEISNYLNGIMYEADIYNIESYDENIFARTGYDRISECEYREKLQRLYEEKKLREHHFSEYGVWSIAYIPSALGIILGRGLGLSYVGVFDLGKFFNLLTYIILVWLAIKKVKYGKVLVSVIGVIPTTIFMAANYSYDSWVTGFTILGFACFISEIQSKEKLENRNIIVMVTTLVLGCLPKAIYFPVLFPLLFMPKSKFKTSNQRCYYYLSIIGAGLFLVSTFLLPMVIGGAGTGDARGGTEVNSTEQIKFIFGNPLKYAKILVKYDLGYIAFANSGAMLQRFSYVGEGYFYSIVGYIMLIIAFLDRGDEKNDHLMIKGAMLFGNLVAVVLSTTALYISFTAVGAETVAGMQGRYLIPTIYPALYSLGIEKVSHKINQNLFVCLPMIIIAFTFICNMGNMCVVGY